MHTDKSTRLRFEPENPLLGAKSAVLGFPQVEHLFKTGVPEGWGG